ncbi:hypothetical protein FHY17_003694 [Xanthomonas arboricola]|uniref:ATP-binding protein n=1 Tax=Xanthomonas arboricola TaxID=56448 RepID=UPI00160EE8EE|nr:ATP-binding protein [Xanthomonas arboricola]MBB3799406.1 hypothetical protein [Xanthomonas arboricola]
MASPTIDFRSIRSHQGSQHGGFEELVCQIAALDTKAGTPFHRKGAGADGGLECFREEADGSETGWQAKFFFELGSSEVMQLKDSFDHAVAKHPALARFIVCLPFDLSDGRLPRRKSERDRWSDWIKERLASIAPRQVEIELWGGFQLTERLARNEAPYVGRRTYWFDVPHFGIDWLREQFQASRKALGRRYTPELNVELPIRQALAAFARDPGLMRRIAGLADDLDEARHRSLRTIAAALEATQAHDAEALDVQTAAIAKAIRTAPLGPADRVPLEHWRDLVSVATKTLDVCWEAIWKIRKQSTDGRDSAGNSLYAAQRLRDALDLVTEAIAAKDVGFANARHLLLIGEAGVGKSHLLADVAEHHIARGWPGVLMLGGTFADAEPWRQIAEQLGLPNVPRDAILGALDAAAEAYGTRALVIVDALNERNGVAVWFDRLAAFLSVTERFPHVAVLVSCRTTFLPYIVRDLDETALPRLEHPGFAGRAAEAARRYLDQRGIVRMAAPHLAPEFENPLFLRTCCDMLERRGSKEFPRGVAGVSSVFDFYYGAIAVTLNQRMGLAPRLKRVETALAALTDAMVDASTGYLPLGDANRILEGIHDSRGRTDQSLFFQLENEGVISVEAAHDGDERMELVRFTFERMSDHRIAQRLLDGHVGKGDPAPAFATGGPLYRYVAGRDSWQFAGIAEALAVQLPERYGVELLDIVDGDSNRWGLVHAFQVSLLWRQQSVFTQRTLDLVEHCADTISGNPVLETLLAIATEPDNRFNANHLDRWLRPLPLPERDTEWSIPVTMLAENEESPIGTLIEWVRANGLETIDPERAKLAAITLAWLTSLSHRWIRDMATKALATLLVDRRDLAATLIDHFADVDDPYVVDRVLAAAYGAATRRSGNENLAELARAAFTAVFARDPLPAHALIRDHARGIIELTAYRGTLPTDVELDLVRPPYPRGTPLEVIPDETLAAYVQDYGGSVFRDKICSSALEDGDFARYEIDSLGSQFLRLPREEHGHSMRDIYEQWHATTIQPHKARLAALARVIDFAERAYAMPHGFGLLKLGSDVQEQQEAYEAAVKRREDAIKDLERLLDREEVEEFRVRASGYLRGRMWSKSAPAWHPTYTRELSRRWVAWRAHELGWTVNRFGAFERKMVSHGRNEHRIERIGKKYQWIAYHELTGRLSDIALVGEYADEPGLYRGPWQIDTREMDPTVLVTKTRQRESDLQEATWWSPFCWRWRNDSPQARIAWMEDHSRDIPDPIAQIDVIDPDGRRWLVLETTASRNHLVMVNGERVIHRMTWHKVKSMLVTRCDADRLQRLLMRSERYRDHPPEVELPSHGYLGEYPWHPAFDEIDGHWEIGELGIPVQATVADWLVERSGHDYSIEDNLNLMVPAPALMRGLDLRLAEGRALSYATADGKILFKTPSAEEPGFGAAVVDRDAMRAFLEAEGLELVWILTGEKSAHGGPPHGRGWGGMLEYWGIYRYLGDAVQGKLNFKHRNPDAEQLEEFLSNP